MALLVDFRPALLFQIPSSPLANPHPYPSALILPPANPRTREPAKKGSILRANGPCVWTLVHISQGVWQEGKSTCMDRPTWELLSEVSRH